MLEVVQPRGRQASNGRGVAMSRASRNSAFRQFSHRLGRSKDRGQGLPKRARAVLLDGHRHRSIADSQLGLDDETFAADLHRAARRGPDQLAGVRRDTAQQRLGHGRVAPNGRSGSIDDDAVGQRHGHPLLPGRRGRRQAQFSGKMCGSGPNRSGISLRNRIGVIGCLGPVSPSFPPENHRRRNLAWTRCRSLGSVPAAARRIRMTACAMSESCLAWRRKR